MKKRKWGKKKGEEWEEIQLDTQTNTQTEKKTKNNKQPSENEIFPLTIGPYLKE